MTKFITHARTMEELRLEFISDINRRLALVNSRIANSPSARRSATLAAIREELDSIVEYWNNVEMVHDKKKPKGDST